MSGTVQQFDFSVDLLQALLWQYNDATRLQTLLERKQGWYDVNQSEFWANWVRDVFDLRTATDFGLAVWAQILNVPLVASTSGSGARPVFGFGPFNQNFEHGNFGQDTDGSLALNLEQKRLVLRLRYFQLTSTGCVPEINEVLNFLFGGFGDVYVLDGLDMTMEYVFTYVPPSNVLFVLEQFDLLPRPQGVGSSIVVTPRDRFGFAPYYLNFENSNFGGRT